MSAAARARVAVLASGGGSNLGALLAFLAERGAGRAADVVLVAGDRAGAGAFERAATCRIATHHLADPADGAGMRAQFEAYGVDLVVLAGYLKHVPDAVTRAYAGRMLNVHPSLLPAFGGPGMYGARVHRAVLAAGACVSGATVHFVDDAYDRGPIAAQWPVPVRANDTPESLAARVLRVEHLLLPRAVEAVAAGRVRVGADGRVHSPYEPADVPFTLPPSATDDDVASALDAALRA
ncbi:phosphoribosylglycinamide formyltransferase [Gemmatimonadetes bacterium T265]|nr:phosphoribosylglycinamide formyltransferase [Gemmatimonadetes bacterium T265]